MFVDENGEYQYSLKPQWPQLQVTPDSFLGKTMNTLFLTTDTERYDVYLMQN